jgi:hypothetical protein
MGFGRGILVHAGNTKLTEGAPNSIRCPGLAVDHSVNWLEDGTNTFGHFSRHHPAILVALQFVMAFFFVYCITRASLLAFAARAF